MVEVTYHCPYCGAVTGVEREGFLDDKCVTREPLAGWEYAAPADGVAAIESADGVEFVCLGNAGDGERDGESEPPSNRPDGPDPTRDGCGRTFYLNYVRYEDGDPVEHRTPDVDAPRFDFSP